MERSSLAVDNEPSFAEVVQLIAASRQRALRAVNVELTELYWKIGGVISSKIEAADWGDGVVEQLAIHRSNAARAERFHTTEPFSNEAVL